ncbi:Phosphatidylserine/phosphatidylglycerophosphate/cardiolipin synthase [Modicisalibacter ilicicola DSM 19980]|uniref:Phosphatidylserine/phosphatidylglycerophosphate/cardiolipin synthase n=1 Tax=Modicisalibacter ilicicola DSM 19980 TaxID=1121942 RepID=A0A1M5BCT5_9GAMM|nr:phospholipase D family protein [Halomonas ilicicola]SHF40363.1 Phosphatidylserine/phosphatidylglycerophosphate/cardiolipin synthase [Halomonas ilicicola DSM 19980]
MALTPNAAETTYLGTWASQSTKRHQGVSGVQLLSDGPRAFALRAALAEHAQRTLDVQTYILENDQAGRALLKRMLHAAERGVRLRLLLDDTASLGKQHLLAAFNSHPNIQVRVFNPVTAGRHSAPLYYLALATDFDRKHRRMHNKLWVTDGSVAITGGRNLANRYFEVAEELNFNDLDVLAIGPVVNALSGSFDRFWNHPMAVPLHYFEQAGTNAWRELLVELGHAARQGDALLSQPTAWRLTGEPGEVLLESLTWAPTVALWDSPEKLEAEGYPALEMTLFDRLRDAFHQVEHRLLIISPYIVPTQASLEYLRSLRGRGVTPTILTNALEATDLPVLHGPYASERPTLLDSGVRLFELRAKPSGPTIQRAKGEITSLHTKAIAFDAERIFIGSMNADPRSVWWNSEVGLLIDSPVLGERLWAIAKQGTAPTRSYEVVLTGDGDLSWRTEVDGRLVTLEEEPGSVWRHFKAWMLRLLGVEHLL